MRRLSLFPLVLTLALALVACGGTAAPSGGDAGGVVVINSVVGGSEVDPAASALPEPTALPSLGLTVENVRYTAQGNGSVTFSAQVANLGTEELNVSKVVIELFDASGGRLTRLSFSNPGLPTLKPGEGATWEGRRDGLDIEWAETRASAVAEPVAAAR